jgi:Protein of unknown function (DUF1566)
LDSTSRDVVALAALLVVGLLGGQRATAQQACAGATSSLPSARFHDNGDGTVTDVESKLMWMRCSSGQQRQDERCVGVADRYGWADAQRHAETVNRDGSAFFNDWRVPALRELATITDRGCANPRTNLAVFPGTPAAPYWSSTARPGERADERVLALSFGAEGVMLVGKSERFHLRLVRTGP